MAKITSNIVGEEEFKGILHDTFNFLSNVLSKTLGPYGSTSLVQSRELSHTISKDGYSVLGQILIREDIPRTLLELILTISRSQVRNVGDGSTSSVIVASSLYDSVFHKGKYNDQVSPKDIINALTVIGEILEKKVASKAISIDLEGDKEEALKVLTKIATISTNNDSKLGKFVASVYGELGSEGYVDVISGNSFEPTYEIKDGLSIPAKVLSTFFINEPNIEASVYVEPAVLLMDVDVTPKEFTDVITPVIEHCVSEQRPLSIIATGFHQSTKKLLIDTVQNNNGLILLNAAEYPNVLPDYKDKILDLATYLGIKRPISFMNLPLAVKEMRTSENLNDFLGSCDQIKMDKSETRFIGGHYEENLLNERIDLIKKEIKELAERNSHIDFDMDLQQLKIRLTELSNSIATVQVGGLNQEERISRSHLVEDAVLACKSCIENGYVLGGNLVIPQIIQKELNEITNSVVKKLIADYGNTTINRDKEFVKYLLENIQEAFENSYRMVLANKFINDKEKIDKILRKCVGEELIYNLKTEEYEDITSSEVINSSYTDINILLSTFSIIGLVGTSNQFVKTSFN